jgi:hypothetical protein
MVERERETKRGGEVDREKRDTGRKERYRGEIEMPRYQI